MSSFPVVLPEGFSSIVQVGDVVTKGQVLAKKKSDAEQVVNIPQQLKVSLKSVKKVLKKNPGDPVRKGDIIAEKKGFLGMNNAAIISNIEGIVFRYERGTGNLVIRTSFDPSSGEEAKNVISPVAGIIALCDNDKIVVRAEDSEGTKEPEETKEIQEVEEIAASGEPKEETEEVSNLARRQSEPIAIFSDGEAEGELFVLEKSFTDRDLSNALYSLTGEASGKIVLAKGFTREMLMKGVGIGVVGFIGEEISKEDRDFFVERESKMPVIQVDEDTLTGLKYWNGKRIRINGEERIISLVL